MFAMNGLIRMPRLLVTGSSPLWSRSLSSQPIVRPTTAHFLSNFELLFLGTGSSSPSRARSSPSTLLHFGGNAWLFDAGEGTMRQLLRTELTTHTDISKMFITHMHADHVSGLSSLIITACNLHQTEKKNGDLVDPPPLHLYGPEGLYQYISSILTLTYSGLNSVREIVVHEMVISNDDVSQFVKNSHYQKVNKVPWPASAMPGVLTSKVDDFHGYDRPLLTHKQLRSDDHGVWTCVEDPNIRVQAKLIMHRVPTFGFVVNESDIVGKLDPAKCDEAGVPVNQRKLLKEKGEVIFEDGRVVRRGDVCEPDRKGRKVTILGDTSDASNILDLAQDSDVCVHEATYGDDMRSKAVHRGHSTPRIAARFAKDSKSKRLCMNHIGAQYFLLNPHLTTSFSKQFNSDIDLQQDARKALGWDRHGHAIVTRDHVSVYVPPGGYSIHDNAFCVSIPRHREHDTQHNKPYTIEELPRKRLEIDGASNHQVNYTHVKDERSVKRGTANNISTNHNAKRPPRKSRRSYR